MGLTTSSTGAKAVPSQSVIRKADREDRVIALAGNPNVGKSTVFNAVTGMNQHTGNWPGKTVALAQGRLASGGGGIMVDLPGAYSLIAHSAEEAAARSFICFGEPDAVVIVCDACCLERNLYLALQIIESGANALICVNLMDEAEKKHIHIDADSLSRRIGVPVVGITAREKGGADRLIEALDAMPERESRPRPYRIRYPDSIEAAADMVEAALRKFPLGRVSRRWLSLRLLEGNEMLGAEADSYLGFSLRKEPVVSAALEEAEALLNEQGIDRERRTDMTVSALAAASEELCRGSVLREKNNCDLRDRRIDRLLTGRLTAYPIMLCLLALVFWLTIVGANYPSALLSDALFWLQEQLSRVFIMLDAPRWLHDCLVLGVYRVLAWVVSVMLPPMAIFFPLFTILEDVGYLPRVAYNLDRPLKRCSACGKQALTMCMGFGCNAAGVVGCRIIDSPRERLLAVLTNSFVPCNGRFPTLIALLSMFFIGSAGGAAQSLISALLLTGVIVLGIAMTLAVTRLLSRTVLKGYPSSFTLELPPYRRPQIGKVILRSIFDRTLFVLGRAAAVAAPAGLIIWLAANLSIGGESLLDICAAFLDPMARLMGMDGVILMAFILGFPANEIVLPIIIMAYTAQGSLVSLDSLPHMRELFVANGWTWMTAASTMLFSLMHWPCSTTLLTIRRETGSMKWTALAAAIPTAAGIVVCTAFTFLAHLLF